MDPVVLKLDLPDWLVAGIKERADMYGVTVDEFVAEALTAFVEKREPEFKREDIDGSDN